MPPDDSVITKRDCSTDYIYLPIVLNRDKTTRTYLLSFISVSSLVQIVHNSKIHLAASVVTRTLVISMHSYVGLNR